MVKHHAGDHNAHERQTTLPNDVRPYISFYFQQSTNFSFPENSGSQTLSLYQDLLETQFIKPPTIPPPIFMV